MIERVHMLASRMRNFQSLRSDTALTDDQIRSVAPSIFAENPHSSRSERYAFIPTSTILNKLREEGFQPMMVAQTRVRDADKRSHAKHLIRLRQVGQVVGTEANEIALLNSHDGSSGYQLLGGQFVFLCANGLVRGNIEHDIRVRHQGNVVDDVIEGVFRVVDEFPQMADERDAMKSLTLNEGERAAFARVALSYRFGSNDDSEPVSAPVTERQLLMPRRREEAKPDLWSTLNVVQENVIRGGIRGRASNGRRLSTRAVTGIDQDVKLNRALYALALEMRKLKAT